MQLGRPRLAPGPQARAPHRERLVRARGAGGVGGHAVPWRRGRWGQEVQAPGGREEGACGCGGRARGCSGRGGAAQARLHMVPERVHLPWCRTDRRAPLLCDGSLRGVCADGDAAKWWTPHFGADSQVWSRYCPWSSRTSCSGYCLYEHKTIKHSFGCKWTCSRFRLRSFSNSKEPH
uniref:Uncharacterized protein n=1 Tax=Arundo donax TaxID=35708 RepID=A0A0A9CNN7_ARUDO